MITRLVALLIIPFTLLSCLGEMAEVIEEIVVTGSYIESSVPGTQLRRKGDNLLLRIDITNDSRDERQREHEIHLTLRNAVEAAAKVTGIALSTTTDNDFVLPLTATNYQIDLQEGSRPDTSRSSFLAKSPIPANVTDGEALAIKLKRFVSGMKLEGRTEVSVDSQVNVSVVNPQQYRTPIIELMAKDINAVTTALGDGYKVIVSGVDQQVDWARVGSLDVAIYLPYTYVVLPDSITSFS